MQILHLCFVWKGFFILTIELHAQSLKVTIHGVGFSYLFEFNYTNMLNLM